MSSFKDNSGLEEHKPKATQAERDEQMKKFLAKGGKVEKLEPGYPLDVGSFDKSRKPRYTREEIKKGETQIVEMKNNLNALAGALQQTDLFIKQIDDDGDVMPPEKAFALDMATS